MNSPSLLYYPVYVKRFEVKAEDLIQVKELGRGAYGAVYEMKHNKTTSFIAVKVFNLVWHD